MENSRQVAPLSVIEMQTEPMHSKRHYWQSYSLLLGTIALVCQELSVLFGTAHHCLGLFGRDQYHSVQGGIAQYCSVLLTTVQHYSPLLSTHLVLFGSARNCSVHLGQLQQLVHSSIPFGTARNCSVLLATAQHHSVLLATACYCAVLLRLLCTAQYHSVLLGTTECCLVCSALLSTAWHSSTQLYCTLLLDATRYCSLLLSTPPYLLALLSTARHCSPLVTSARICWVLFETDVYFLVLLGTARYNSIIEYQPRPLQLQFCLSLVTNAFPASVP